MVFSSYLIDFGFALLYKRVKYSILVNVKIKPLDLKVEI